MLTIVYNNNCVFFYLHPQCGMFGWGRHVQVHEAHWCTFKWLTDWLLNIDQNQSFVPQQNLKSTLVGGAWGWIQNLVAWLHVRCCVWVLVLGLVILDYTTDSYWTNDLISLNTAVTSIGNRKFWFVDFLQLFIKLTVCNFWIWNDYKAFR